VIKEEDITSRRASRQALVKTYIVEDNFKKGGLHKGREEDSQRSKRRISERSGHHDGVR
jgi:hypothetical protein